MKRMIPRNIIVLKGTLLVILACMISCVRDRTDKSPEHGIPLMSSIVIDKELKDSVELDITKIATDLRLVRLETNDSCVLGNLYKMIISDGFIFLGTEKDYYLFNDKGEFLGIPIESGRGPEEVVTPSFSNSIRNDKLFFSDSGKNDDYIYFINLATGEQGRVPKAGEGYVDKIVHDSDTTLLYISNNYTSAKDNLSANYNYYVIRQDLNGNIISRVQISEKIEISRYMQGLYSLFYDPENIIISTPRCDTIFRFTDEGLESVWANVFMTNYNDNQYFQRVAFAELLHYSDDTILIRRHIDEITIDRTYARRMGGNRQLLLIDRLSESPILVNKLFFFDKNVELVFNINWNLDNNLFCFVVTPKEIFYLLNNPDISDSVKQMIVPGLSTSGEEITAFDNPFLLIGKF